MSKLLLRSYNDVHTKTKKVSIHIHSKAQRGAYLLDFSFAGQNQILLRYYIELHTKQHEVN